MESNLAPEVTICFLLWSSTSHNQFCTIIQSWLQYLVIVLKVCMTPCIGKTLRCSNGNFGRLWLLPWSTESCQAMAARDHELIRSCKEAKNGILHRNAYKIYIYMRVGWIPPQGIKLRDLSALSNPIHLSERNHLINIDQYNGYYT